MEAKFIGKAKITKSGQVTLPKEARQDLKIGENSEIYWYELNDAMIMVKNLANEKEILSNIMNSKKKRSK